MAFVEVDRERCRLRLYQVQADSNKYEITAKYDVAVGAAEYPTDRGLYYIEHKARAKFPDWTMPDSEWVQPPELRGTTIKGDDPRNPIKARWIRVTEDGVGIHGTSDLDSIGLPASHGCIRMRVEDVIELYDQVRAGDLVYIL